MVTGDSPINRASNYNKIHQIVKLINIPENGQTQTATRSFFFYFGTSAFIALDHYSVAMDHPIKN